MSTLVSSERPIDEEHQQRSMKDTHHDQDLMLAAEIGKSLLERNRELEVVLKATQEYAEEQTAQTDFYMKQVEILRNGQEMSSRTCEQLEANNRALGDKYEQSKQDVKILEGKNARLWEVINNLETRVEELSTEVQTLNEQLAEFKEREEEAAQVNRKPPEKQQSGRHVSFHDPIAVASDLPSPCETEKENLLKKQLSELNIANKLTHLEKGEMESQLDDLTAENQTLYQKISNLNQEIEEWEKFAWKEENYRRLAAAFTLRHYAEVEVEPHHLDKMEHRISQTLIPNTKMVKAKSCECLDYFANTTSNTTNNNNNNNNNNKRQQRGGGSRVKTSTLVNSILSGDNSGSFLSELDSEYAELMERYESLLDSIPRVFS